MALHNLHFSSINVFDLLCYRNLARISRIAWIYPLKWFFINPSVLHAKHLAWSVLCVVCVMHAKYPCTIFSVNWFIFTVLFSYKYILRTPIGIDLYQLMSLLELISYPNYVVLFHTSPQVHYVYMRVCVYVWMWMCVCIFAWMPVNNVHIQLGCHRAWIAAFEDMLNA